MASFSSKADGAWQAEGNTTWVENGHPATGDTVSIGAHNITLAQAEACNTIAFSGAGTITGGGFTLTVSGASCDLSGGTISGNLDVTCTETIAAAKFDGSTGNVRTLTVNGATKTVTFGAGVSCTTLTITAGTVDTNSTDNNALTVSGRTRLDGTLICNASTCSFGSGISGSGNWAMNLQGGTFTGGTGAHTFGSITLVTGTFTATTGVTTINSVEANDDSFAKADAATFTHSSGTLTFTRAGAQLFWSGSASISFGTIIVNNASCALGFHTGYGHALTCATLTITAGSFNTNATNNNALTVTGITRFRGTLTCNASTCSFGSGLTDAIGTLYIEANAVFNGGSGTHTIGVLHANLASGTNTINMSSGTTTINGRAPIGQKYFAFAIYSGSTFNHNNGTIAFTYAGIQTLYRCNGQATTLYNIIVNNADCVLKFYDQTNGFNLTCTALTITAGIFDTSNYVDSTSYALTVTGVTSITGTLTCNASAITLGSLSTAAVWVVVINAGGTLTGGTGTHIYGNILNSGTWTATSGTTTINGINTVGVGNILANAGTFTHSSGTIAITQTTANGILNVNDVDITFNILTISTTGYTVFLYSTVARTVTVGTLNITAGTVNTRYSTLVNVTLTVTGVTSVAGTLTCNASTCSFGGGSDTYTLTVTGTFTGGTGTHTIGGLNSSSGVVVLTSGTTTVNGTRIPAFHTNQTAGTNYSAGTVVFNNGGTLTLISSYTGGDRTFGTVQISGTTTLVITTGTGAFNLLCTTCTIDAGCSFNTNATDNNSLTVSGVTTVTGTLTLNASTCSFGSGIGADSSSYGVTVGGTFTGGTGTHTINSFRNDNSSTLSTGATEINGRYSAGTTISLSCQGGTLSCPGTVTFTLAGTQNIDKYLGYVLTIDGNIVVNKTTGNSVILTRGSCNIGGYLTITSGTFSTGADLGLTVSGVTTVAGTLTCNASTCSFGSEKIDGTALSITGTFNGNTATITSGLVYLTGGTFNATTGVHTINGRSGAYEGLAFSGGTFNHNSGTITFTLNTLQKLVDLNNTARTFGTIIINNASCQVYYRSTYGFNLTATTLTITAGSFTSWDGTTSYNLTVSGVTTVTGTLTCNASTVSLGSGKTDGFAVTFNGGTLNSGSSTITSGAVYLKDSGTWNATTGVHTINGHSSSTQAIAFIGSTFNHNSGTISFTYPGTVYLYDNTNTARTFGIIIINNASCALRYQSTRGFNLTATTLTITAGSFTSWDGTTSYPLTVSGSVGITGTLDGKAGAMSFGSLTINSGGAYSATSGTTTITSKNPENYILNFLSGGFTHNNGTVTINSCTGGTNYIITGSSSTGRTFYNLNLLPDSATTFLIPAGGNNFRLDVANNFVIGPYVTASGANLNTVLWVGGDMTVNGTLTNSDSAARDRTVTVIGNTIVNGNWLANLANDGMSVTIGSLTINSGGAYSATSGTTTLSATGDLTIAGTFTHNNGTLAIAATGITVTLTTAVTTLNNLTIGNGSTFDTGSNFAVTCAATLTSSGTSSLATVTTVGLAVTGGTTTSTATYMITASSTTISSGATLNIVSGSRFKCCNVVNNGAFTIDGSWLCGSDGGKLDAGDKLDWKNRLDRAAVTNECVLDERNVMS